MQPRHIFGILGHPVSQSLSPLLHNWGFGLFAYPGVYMSFDKTPAELRGFMEAARTLPLAGLSVTIPHKEAVMACLDLLTDRARAVGAVNTVYWRDGKLVGENTDVAGFLGPLQGSPSRASALVLGAGGAARAVLAGLREAGLPRIAIAARRREQAELLARAFQAEAVAWEDRANALEPGCLVVNATPLGMRGKTEDQSPLPAGVWKKIPPEDGLAYDLVYNPARTRFLREAAAGGWKIQEGLDFFAIQGKEQFRLWTGRELPLDEAREILRAELERRG